MSERKWRGPITLLSESRRFRLAVVLALVAPILYVASFGPACWLCAIKVFPLVPVGWFYLPLVYRAWHVGFGTDFLYWYATAGNRARFRAVVPDLLDAVARS